MNIQVSMRYCIAFMALFFLCSQLHEMVHIITGRFICGCWGEQQDFNLWSLCADCEQHPYKYIATLAGPVFTYLMIWLGVYWLSLSNTSLQVIGFAFVLANHPFARIFTAAMGRGDEITVLRFHLAQAWSHWYINVLGLFLVLIFAFLPLYYAYCQLEHRYKLQILIGFCVIPLVVQWFYEFKFLGWLIQSGVMNEAHFMGIADFVHLHTLLCIIVLFAAGKHLYQFAET